MKTGTSREATGNRGKAKVFGFALCALLLVLCVQVSAQQQGKIPRVGFLTGSPLSSQLRRNEAFRQGLRELGYLDGKNIVIEWRSYEGQAIGNERSWPSWFVQMSISSLPLVRGYTGSQGGNLHDSHCHWSEATPLGAGSLPACAAGRKHYRFGHDSSGDKRKTTRTSKGSSTKALARGRFREPTERRQLTNAHRRLELSCRLVWSDPAIFRRAKC